MERRPNDGYVGRLPKSHLSAGEDTKIIFFP